MVSKVAFIGIGIAIGLAVGIGIGFGLTSNTSSNLEKQIEDQSSRIATLESDLKSANKRLETLQESSPDMQSMIQMIMEDPDMMKQLMDSMIEEPELKQTMMEQMTQMQEMMDQDMMMDDVMSKQMQFNADAPITIPMIDGYYNGNKVYFVHTEVSDKDTADMMTMMVNFPTLYVPELTDITTEQLGKVYIFTNGIPGSGPYGGGPFFFQIDIFDAVPGKEGYSQFRNPQLVTWKENSNPRLLTSVEELLEAQANGELSIEKTDLVVNAPTIVWTSDDGKEQTATTIQNMFESMHGVDGSVVNVDIKNYIATFKLKSDKQMNMMKQNVNNKIPLDSVDFTDIQVTQISETTAMIQGMTDIPVFCQVEYGTNGSFTDSASDSMDMMNMKHYKHEITITDLEPSTLYNYRFKATVDDQIFYSDTKTFMTE